MEQKKHSGLGIASLILGIFGILLACAVIGIIPSIIGLIFSIIAICDKSKKKGISIAGLICSSIGVLLFCVIFFIVLISGNDDDTVNNSNSVTNEIVAADSDTVQEMELNVVPSDDLESINNATSITEERDGWTLEHYIAIVFLIGFFIFCIWISSASSSPKIPKYDGQQRKCPRCGGSHFHAFVEEQVVVPGKVKSQTTLNLNPLKPFTVFNHKEKIVRREVTQQVTRFLCDDCGNIFQ